MDISEQALRQEIKTAIINALQRGETFNQAISILISSGYPKDKISQVANELVSQGIIKVEMPAFLKKELESAKARQSLATLQPLKALAQAQPRAPIIEKSKTISTKLKAQQQPLSRMTQPEIKKPLIEKKQKPIPQVTQVPVKPSISKKPKQKMHKNKMLIFASSTSIIYFVILLIVMDFKNNAWLFYLTQPLPLFILFITALLKQKINKLLGVIMPVLTIGLFFYLPMAEIHMASVKLWLKILKTLLFSPSVFFAGIILVAGCFTTITLVMLQREKE